MGPARLLPHVDSLYYLDSEPGDEYLSGDDEFDDPLTWTSHEEDGEEFNDPMLHFEDDWGQREGFAEEVLSQEEQDEFFKTFFEGIQLNLSTIFDFVTSKPWLSDIVLPTGSELDIYVYAYLFSEVSEQFTPLDENWDEPGILSLYNFYPDDVLDDMLWYDMFYDLSLIHI